MNDNRFSWLESYEEMIEWADSLHQLPETLWLEPIAEGKWSIAEIISHFYSWDRFIFEERLLKLSSQNFISANPQETNEKAAKFARSGVSREELLSIFIDSRKQICTYIKSLPQEILQTSFQVGNSQYTIPEYIEVAMVKHDHLHRKQLEDFLEKKQVYIY
ncbi:DinB family protein [Pseudalkalibacillus sp. SCS-8]|uniref:DinB family protein n=1 Tax=Pseudalkalibacillus nanhaiensis TaxID=3115291 RepID=UPI0032DA9A02